MIKQKRHIVVLLVSMIAFFSGFPLAAQTYAIPDVNLRNCLLVRYPSVMDTVTEELKIVLANSKTGTLDISNAGITNIDGIQHFTDVDTILANNNQISSVGTFLNNLLTTKKIDLSHNEITSFPYLPDTLFWRYLILSHNNLTTMGQLTALEDLYELHVEHNNLTTLPSCNSTYLETIAADYNELTSLPSFAANTSLAYFTCSHNNLTTHPTFSANTNLRYLDLSYNSISIVPSLNHLTELISYNINHNNLTSLPPLTLPKLQYLKCVSNNITSLPFLNTLPKLKHLFLDSNQITVLPPLDANTSLRQLHFSSNRVSALPFLPDSIAFINGSYNRITVMPSFNSFPIITNLYFNSNDIEVLPDLSGKPMLIRAEFRDNQLHYSDMLPHLMHPNFPSVFAFNQQNYLKPGGADTLRERESFLFKATIDTLIAGLTYEFLKDGYPIANVTGTGTSAPFHLIDSVQLSDAGIYQVRIYNSYPQLSNFALLTEPFYFGVLPCIDATNVQVNVSEKTCEQEGAVSIDLSTIEGLHDPFALELANSADTLTPSGASLNEFKELKWEQYDLIVTDTQGCKKVYPNKIFIPQKNKDCDKLILTPDGDNKNDELVISEPGKARIYNSNGKLIRELQTPGIWDGRDQNGLVPPGYYTITVNDTIIRLTVIH